MLVVQIRISFALTRVSINKSSLVKLHSFVFFISRDFGKNKLISSQPAPKKNM